MTRSARFIVALASTAFFSNVPAAPEAELWAYWDASNPSSEQSIDHGAWDEFLSKYVEPGPDGVNLVEYSKVSDKDKKRLDAYVDELAGVRIREYSKPEQLAYWINLYNALTLKVVLEHYPVQSIKDIDISPGFFSVGPWGRKLLKIEGKEVSLDDIEHRILRPIWRDPRIHYAVNCASIGCPNLVRTAYTADNAQQLLEQGAVEYINHPRGAAATGDGLVVSSIYDWFTEDFGGTEEGVLAHLAEYAGPGLEAEIRSGADIDRYRYDWALNDANPSSAPEPHPGS